MKNKKYYRVRKYYIVKLNDGTEVVVKKMKGGWYIIVESQNKDYIGNYIHECGLNWFWCFC